MQAKIWFPRALVGMGAVFFAVGPAANAAPRVSKPASKNSMAALVRRPDVGANLGSLPCGPHLSGLPAWEQGIYDAQIEGRQLVSVAREPVSDERLEQAAKALARARHGGGYDFGRCETNKGWALATPSPAPLDLDLQKKTMRLPKAALDDRCKDWRLDFAASRGGRPRPISVARAEVDLAAFDDGVIALTCQPRAPRWLGPVLWFLAPVGRGPAQDVPEGGGLEAVGQIDAHRNAAALLAWVNRIRGREGFGVLAESRGVVEAASSLTVQAGVTHDRQLLKRVAATLASSDQLTLVGEDRVVARDTREIAWLLWNSPRHRAFLLRDDVTAGAFSVRPLEDGRFLAVLALASGASLTTAERDSPKAKTRKAQR